MTLGRLEKWLPEEQSEIAYYKQLLRKSPTKYSLLNFLANALYKQAEYKEAIHCWLKLLQKLHLKEEFRIYIKVAQAYEALGEIEHAYHFYGEAVKKSKKNLDAVGKFGQMAYILENYEDAQEAFRLVTEKEPYNEVAWHNLALTLYNLGFHDEALEYLNLSISLDEESADTWYITATVYAENFQLDDALFALEKALTLDPSLRNQASYERSFYTLMDLSLFRFMIAK